MDNILSSYFGSDSQADTLLVQQLAEELRVETISDSIIPDTIADVERIVLTTATPKVDGYYFVDSTLELEGTMVYEVLFQTEKHELTALTVSEPFTLKKELTFPATDCRVILIPTLNYVTSRLVNPRKLNLRSQVTVSTRLFTAISAKPEVSGTESLDDDMNLQRCHKAVVTADLVTAEEKSVPASLDMELDGNAPPASEILSAHVMLHPAEIRSHGEETDIHTEAVLTLLYRTEEGNIFSSEKRFFLDKTLAILMPENAEWLATATPGTVSAKIVPNAYGEMKTIEIDFPYALSLTGIGTKSVETVVDMYSTEYECETAYHSLSVMRPHRLYSTNLTVNASAPRSDVGGESVRNLLDGFVTLQNYTIAHQEDKNRLLIEGTLSLSLVGENHAVEGYNTPFSPISFTYPFRCELDAGALPTDAEYLAEIGVIGAKYRCDSDHIYADLELAIRIMSLASIPTPYLQHLHLNRTVPIHHPTAPITLCYPSGQETLWDIAKYYRLTADALRRANNLKDDDITDRKVLLIPREQPKKAIFSQVV